MAISRTLFDLKPHSIDDPKVLRRKLVEALVDTVGGEEDKPLTGELWIAISEYDRGDISDEEFISRVQERFPD